MHNTMSNVNEKERKKSIYPPICRIFLEFSCLETERETRKKTRVAAKWGCTFPCTLDAHASSPPPRSFWTRDRIVKRDRERGDR